MNRLMKLKVGERFNKGDVGYYNMDTGNANLGLVTKEDGTGPPVIATKKCTSGETTPWSRANGLTKLGMPPTGEARAIIYVDTDTSRLTDIASATTDSMGIIVRPGVGLIMDFT